MNVKMVPCPDCGVELSESLVVAIRDPRQPESCPHVTPVRPEPVVVRSLRDDASPAERRMIAYAMLAIELDRTRP